MIANQYPASESIVVMQCSLASCSSWSPWLVLHDVLVVDPVLPSLESKTKGQERINDVIQSNDKSDRIRVLATVIEGEGEEISWKTIKFLVITYSRQGNNLFSSFLDLVLVLVLMCVLSCLDVVLHPLLSSNWSLIDHLWGLWWCEKSTRMRMYLLLSYDSEWDEDKRANHQQHHNRLKRE